MKLAVLLFASLCLSISCHAQEDRKKGLAGNYKFYDSIKKDIQVLNLRYFSGKISGFYSGVEKVEGNTIYYAANIKDFCLYDDRFVFGLGDIKISSTAIPENYNLQSLDSVQQNKLVRKYFGAKDHLKWRLQYNFIGKTGSNGLQIQRIGPLYYGRADQLFFVKR